MLWPGSGNFADLEEEDRYNEVDGESCVEAGGEVGIRHLTRTCICIPVRVCSTDWIQESSAGTEYLNAMALVCRLTRHA